MADGLNRWTGIGNLCADPELRVTQGGQSVLKLRLACNESYLDKNNTRQERTEFVSVTMWGKRGDSLAKFLKKGDRLYAEGSLRTSSYEKSPGDKRYTTEVNALNIILCGGGKREGSGGRQQSEESQGAQGAFGGSSMGDPDDELPF